MPKFKIEFTHVEKRTFETEIEASSEKEAEKIFREDPFGSDYEETYCEGLELEIENIEEI